jgi:tRNA G10  N-methylase Trm11
MIHEYLENYSNGEQATLFPADQRERGTLVDNLDLDGIAVPRYVNEYWTSKQRQASSIHEVSYRACFKPQLPAFFIELLTKPGGVVYDPFSGRGTTAVEAGIRGRNVIANDINPISRIMTQPRMEVPSIEAVVTRLSEIRIDPKAKADLDLSMFYQAETEAEIESLRRYLISRNEEDVEDKVDRWIRMVATNRLTGHSSGFFSVYSLPPNQAVSQESQRKINEKLSQTPTYRDVRQTILKKTKSLLRNLNTEQLHNLCHAGESALFLTGDARETARIPDECVQLTVTSPPFLDIVQYSKDNWLRCWFNNFDDDDVASKITMSKTVDDWRSVMSSVFCELFRVTRQGGWVAFEVGEVRNGKVKLDEVVVPLGTRAGFMCQGIMINSQSFTKTSNIWGITNNSSGTNTNRIVLFQK